MFRLSSFLFLLLLTPVTVFAQIQDINVGATANDGTGDSLRTAGIKINENFDYHETEITAVEADVADHETRITTLETSPDLDDAVILAPATTARNTIQPSAASQTSLTLKTHATPGEFLLLRNSADNIQAYIPATGHYRMQGGASILWSSTSAANGTLDAQLSRTSVGSDIMVGAFNGSGTIDGFKAAGFYAEDGTNTAPTHTFSSDTNTGFYLGAADTLSFSSGGSRRMTVHNTGVVFETHPIFDQNDVSVTSDSNAFTPTLRGFQVLTPNANRNFNGWIAPSEDGARILVTNASSTNHITFAHDSASATAANRFLCPDGITAYLEPGTSALLSYDGTASRWRFIDLHTVKHKIIAVRAAAQSISGGGAANAITLDSTPVGTASGLSVSGGTVTIARTGTYTMNAQAFMTGMAAGNTFRIDIDVNGTNICTDIRERTAAITAPGCIASVTYALTAGDVVTLELSQNSGGALNTSTGTNSRPMLSIVEQ